MSEQLILGVIMGARGMHGEVRIKTFTEHPLDIAKYGPLSDEKENRVVELNNAKIIKGGISARIPGVDSRTDAEALKGLNLFVNRNALPELLDEEFYHADLIGLQVISVNGAHIGIVREIHDFGAGDVMEIAMIGRAPLVIQFTKDTVPEIHIAQGYLVVQPWPEIGCNHTSWGDS